MEIDNNKAENAIRPFVIGRKTGCLPAVPGAQRPASCCTSLIETAKANALEPRAYLNHLFEHLPAAKPPEAIDALLPTI